MVGQGGLSGFAQEDPEEKLPGWQQYRREDISIGREDLENCVECIKASCSIGTVTPDMVEELVKPGVTLACGGVGGVQVDHHIPQLGDVCSRHWQEGGEHREQVLHGLEEDAVGTMVG